MELVAFGQRGWDARARGSIEFAILKKRMGERKGTEWDENGNVGRCETELRRRA